MSTQKLVGDLQVSGSIRAGGGYLNFSRSDITEQALAEYQISPLAWRVWNAVATLLTGTPNNDDLGIATGTLGTDFPYVWAGDLKTVTNTRYGALILPLPPEYVSGGDIRLRFHAGMLTTPSDGTATLDLQAYASDGEAGVGSDLCQTNAQSINSTTLADKDFVIDGSGLVPGDIIIARAAIAVADTASGTAVDAAITETKLLLDIKG